VIERDPKLAAAIEAGIDAKVIRGDGASVQDLVDANVEECELFMSLTSENSVNLVSGSMAKSLGVRQVLGRVHPNLQREEWMFDFRKQFSIDHLFSSERLTAIELSKFIRNPDSHVVEEMARGKIELQQVRVSPRSEAVGQSLQDFAMPERTRVAVISRRNEHIIPTAETQFEVGDMVTIFGEPRKLTDLACQLHAESKPGSNLRVVVFGGNEYGFSLAQMLSGWGAKVRIFDKEEERCRELADLLPKVTVINADATVVTELEEEQVGEADFFVAASLSDEDNVMTCLQAHNLGVENCLTLIHRADYARAISSSGRHFGIMAAVSPREACQKDVERYITTDSFHYVKKLGAGDVIETRVKEGATAVGQAVGEVEWPEECVIVGLMRGLQAHVPTKDDALEAGDHLYAMVAPGAMKSFLKLVR